MGVPNFHKAEVQKPVCSPYLLSGLTLEGEKNTPSLQLK